MKNTFKSIIITHHIQFSHDCFQAYHLEWIEEQLCIALHRKKILTIDISFFKTPILEIIMKKIHVWHWVVHICFKLFSLVGHTHEWKTISQDWWIVVLTIRSFQGSKKIQGNEFWFLFSKVPKWATLIYTHHGENTTSWMWMCSKYDFIASSKNIHTTWLNVHIMLCMHNKQPHM